MTRGLLLSAGCAIHRRRWGRRRRRGCWPQCRTVMRHFFRLPVTQALLPLGVLASSAAGPLVLRASSTPRLEPLHLAAAIGAVDLAEVAAATNADLLMAAHAVEQSATLFGHGTCRAAGAFWTWAPECGELPPRRSQKRRHLEGSGGHLSLHFSCGAIHLPASEPAGPTSRSRRSKRARSKRKGYPRRSIQITQAAVNHDGAPTAVFTGIPRVSNPIDTTSSSPPSELTIL